MAPGAIQRGVISAAMEVVNCGDVHGDSTKRSNAHVEGKHVCHIILIILRALMRFLGYCRAPAQASAVEVVVERGKA